MASKDEICNIITQLHSNYKNDGFLVLNSQCQLQTLGDVLVDYKGLKIVTYKRSLMVEGELDVSKFNSICHQRCETPNPVQHIKQLYAQLSDQFPHCLIAVVNGDNYQSSGELITYKKGDLSVYLY